MNEKSIPNNIENDDFNQNIVDSHYINLITRLKEIRLTIALLEKTIFK